MESFLSQPEATFYHITTGDRWATIQDNGLRPSDGRLFVSRVGELPVLLAIALEQLPEIYSANEIVFLKLPQALNQFNASEITQDHQARVEWSQPFQNIIHRSHPPPSGIELMMTIPLDNGRAFLLQLLTRIANQGSAQYPAHAIMTRANELRYQQ